MKKIVFIVILVVIATVASAQSRQPYSQWFGYNQSYDSYTAHSEVTVKAPYNSSVVVIIRKGNSSGSVAGHMYLCSGSQGTIQLKNGTYQVFFYYGNNWSSQLDMGNGIKGGFTRNVQYSKDNPVQLYNNVLTYELILQQNGNFSTKPSNKNEVF